MFSNYPNMRTGVFLQARLGSSRLPHKILLDLQGRTVLEHAMRRLSLVNTDVHAVLTDSHSYSVINKICASVPGWECFEGPAEDVLARYVFAARHFAVDRIIRATADNPLVSYRLANLLLDFPNGAPGPRHKSGHQESGHQQSGPRHKTGQQQSGQQQSTVPETASGIGQFPDDPADYLAHSGIPYGCGVESVASAALEQAFVDSVDPYDHEHVCPYIYNHPHIFTIRTVTAPREFQGAELRLTLDTREDYRYLSSLFHSHEMDALPELPSILKSIYSLAV